MFDGKQVKVIFSDTGPGIDENLKEKIFEPSFTTKVSSKETGMGLGLFIVRQIIKDHEATLTLETGNRKTTFSVYLPTP
jgi:signal transduction histidine kinase